MYKLVIVLICATLFSCSSKEDTQEISGKFIYVEKPRSDLGTTNYTLGDAFKTGLETGCSIVDSFEFKNGYCYFSVLGGERRCRYEVDKQNIYLMEGEFTGVGFKIIDNNTLEYFGCTFKKI